MTACYRILHFAPDPFSGLRFPVAAVVREQGGQVKVVPAPKLPSADCVGDPRAVSALNLIAPDLKGGWSHFDRLPRHFGPHFKLSAPVELDVENPLVWVMNEILPQKPEKKRSPRLSTLGTEYFSAKHLEVSSRYVPADGGAEPVTHYVENPLLRLLMEPVSPERPAPMDDVRQAATRLRAHHDYPADKTVEFFVYVLQGPGRAFLRDVKRLVPDYVKTVDVACHAEEEPFLARVREARPVH